MKNYAITHANIITENINDDVLNDATIIIKDGVISDIGTNLKIEKGLKIIDLKGKYIVPGLINLHVHLPGSGMPKDNKKQNKETVHKLMGNPLTRYIVYKLCAKYAKTELLSGVTTIRTVGGLDNIDSTIRDNINNNKLVGPRILTSNMAISVPGGHMAGLLAYEAKDENDGVNYVNKIAKTRPDLIKLMITGGVLDAKKEGEPGVLRMSPEIVNACSNKAHELGYEVAAHVESPLGVKVALKGNVDTIEHGADIDEEDIALFKAHHAKHVLTISPIIPMSMFPFEISHGNKLLKTNSMIVFKGMISCAKKCLENNIPVGLGTDTACPFVTHYDMWRELIYFVKYIGVSNAFALKTATIINAKIAKIDNVTGSIEINKSADLIVVNGNPNDDLKVLRNPSMVIFKGKLYSHPKLKKYTYVENELDKYL